MSLFHRFRRNKHQRSHFGLNHKAHWETADEFPAEELHDAATAFDPMGSYTGVPLDGGQPEQDADDL